MNFSLRNFTFSFVLLFSFVACNNKPVQEVKITSWIPQSTGWAIQINQFEKIRQELQNNDFFKVITDTYPSISAEIEEFFNDENIKPGMLCIGQIGVTQNVLTYIYNDTDIGQLESSPYTLYNDEKIYFKKKNNSTIYTAKTNGLIIKSNSKLIIENRIRLFQKGIIEFNNNNFNEIYNLADKSAPLNFFVLPQKDQLLSFIIKNPPLFPNFNNDWHTFDISFNEPPFEIDGIIKSNDSLIDRLGIIKDIKAESGSIEELVPSSFTSFLSIPLQNHFKLEDNFRKWLLSNSLTLPNYDFSKLENIINMGWIWFDNEAFLTLKSKEIDSDLSVFVKNPEKEFSYMGEKYYRTKFEKPYEILFSTLGSSIEAKYVSLIDDTFIFTSSENGLKKIIESIKNKETLAYNKEFINFKDKSLIGKSSILWVGRSNALFNFFESHKQNEIIKLDNINPQKYSYFSYEGINENDFMHIHFRIGVSKNINETAKPLVGPIVMNLENPIASRPQWMKNHRTKGYDIAIQDTKNILYLFSSKGVLYWKKQLDSPIIGDLKQVDLYKNKKWQLAFRTKNIFYILDRNGKIVKPFSIKVPSDEPILPLSVFDYDGKRDYRFIISQGNSVTMYNNKGKKVNGFKYNTLKKPLSHPLKHILIKNKDYIVAQNIDGEVSILNRLGRRRVKIQESIEFSDNPITLYLNTFTGSDKNGNLIQIKESGKVEKTPQSLSSDHRITSTPKSLVTLSGTSLLIKGNLVTLPDGAYTKPKIFYLQNIIYVTVTNTKTQQVYLFYSNGESVKGFPVKGDSEADLSNADNDKAVELTVSSEDNQVLIYKLNEK